jgi:hypothetical protein
MSPLEAFKGSDELIDTPDDMMSLFSVDQQDRFGMDPANQDSNGRSILKYHDPRENSFEARRGAWELVLLTDEVRQNIDELGFDEEYAEELALIH